MKIQSFYSFNSFLKNTKDALDFNSYGNLLNVLFKSHGFLNYFNSEVKFSEFRLFFELKLIDNLPYRFDLNLKEKPNSKPFQGIVFFAFSCENHDWSSMSQMQKKELLISAWTLFFKHLPSHYLTLPLEELIEKTKELLNVPWQVSMPAVKNIITFNKEKFEPYVKIGIEKTKLYLVSDTIEVFIKEYETHDIFLRCDFYAIKLKGEILTVEPLFISEITEVNFKQLLEAERKQQGKSNQSLD